MPRPLRYNGVESNQLHGVFSPQDNLFAAGVVLHLGGFMSLGVEILSLRQDKFSSVATLLGALERRHASKSQTAMRDYAVTESADLVLLNVAAHAMEALALLPTRTPKRASSVPRSRRSRYVQGRHQGQILMFALS